MSHKEKRLLEKILNRGSMLDSVTGVTQKQGRGSHKQKRHEDNKYLSCRYIRLELRGIMKVLPGVTQNYFHFTTTFFIFLLSLASFFASIRFVSDSFSTGSEFGASTCPIIIPRSLARLLIAVHTVFSGS